MIVVGRDFPSPYVTVSFEDGNLEIRIDSRDRLASWMTIQMTDVELERLRDEQLTANSFMCESTIFLCHESQKQVFWDQYRDIIIPLDGGRWTTDFINLLNGHPTQPEFDAAFQASDAMKEAFEKIVMSDIRLSKALALCERIKNGPSELPVVCGTE